MRKSDALLRKDKSSVPAQEDTIVKGFPVSVSSLFAFLFMGSIAICLCFVGGIMVGRQTAATQLPLLQAETNDSPGEAESKAVPSPILKPEELEFARALREESGPDVPQAQEETIEEVVPEPDPQICDYVFQMGAFKDENTVDSLRQTLEGYGLRTSMKQSGKVLLVLVRLRGNGERVAEINKLAGELRLGAPLVLQKTPIMESPELAGQSASGEQVWN